MRYAVLAVVLMASAVVLFTAAPLLAEENKTHEGKVVSAGEGKLIMTGKSQPDPFA